MVEREPTGKGEATVRSGHDLARGHGDEGGTRFAGLDFKAMPEGCGDLAEFAFGDEVEVEEDEGEVSISKEEVGALDGLLGFGTTDPDETAAFFVAVRSGVETVSSIDEGEGQIAFFFEEFGNDEGGSGGLTRGDDLAELTRGEFEGSLWKGFPGSRKGSTMSGRELLTKLTAELLDLENAQNMFNRTAFEKWSRREEGIIELG